MARHVERPGGPAAVQPHQPERGRARGRDRLDRRAGRWSPPAARSTPSMHGGRTNRIGQGNNAFVFPGVGLGALVAEAQQVTDWMFPAAAGRWRGEVDDRDLQAGSLYPRIGDMRAVTARVAEAVVREAREACVGLAYEDAAIPGAVSRFMWEPAYPELLPAPSARPRPPSRPRCALTSIEALRPCRAPRFRRETDEFVVLVGTANLGKSAAAHFLRRPLPEARSWRGEHEGHLLRTLETRARRPFPCWEPWHPCCSPAWSGTKRRTARG